MKLRSDSFANGAPIPERFAAGKLEGLSGVTFSDNLSPHLAWEPGPAGTKSYVIVCHDPDVPSVGDDVNQADREVPATLPRVDFFHWVLIDLPLGVTELVEGEFSRGFTPRGKPGPASLHGARHGLNDYTGWFASDAAMAGSYFGYDGPFPPFNDALMHRYVFTLYALKVAKLSELDGPFTGPLVRQAMQAHVLASSTWAGTYTLNRRLRVA
jgi:Raf kinase inhibitor-like YbhB/YbcL family protein